MAMPTNYQTQSISFLQMQAEFGGSNPISFSEYFRGGAPASQGAARVPDFYIAQVAQYVARTYSIDNLVTQTNGGPSGVSQIWTFGSVEIMNGSGNFTTLSSEQNSTAYAYRRGAFQSSTTTPADSKTGEAAYTTSYYVIERFQYVDTLTYVNQYVPASGTISLFQFYNARDYS